MSFASLSRSIVFFGILSVLPVLSYSADFKEFWNERGGAVKERIKSSDTGLQDTNSKEAKQNEKGGISISRQPGHVDSQAPVQPPSPLLPPAEAHPKENVMRVQALLSELGYEPGPVDGVLGPQTRMAIKTFQENIGIPSTGEADTRLISQLEMEVTRRKRAEKKEPKIARASPKTDKHTSHSLDALPKIPGPLTSQKLKAQDIFRKVKDSVVILVAANFRKEISQGSAVAVSPRHLLTNYHVIKNQPFILVKLDQQIVEARLTQKNEERDVCVLILEEPKLVPIRGVRKFQELEVGETVYTVGAPSGLEFTLSGGIISAKREDKDRHMKLIQTSAPISPGSSGGGLFDSYGNLIGITTFTYRDSQNLNFAISAEEYWK